VPRTSEAGAAFEEAVRYESPVQTFFRTTTRPVDIAGIAVGEGEKVLMFLGAANHDRRRWERPDEYDITRRTTGHVGRRVGPVNSIAVALRASAESTHSPSSRASSWPTH
jgi:cytochrome P450